MKSVRQLWQEEAQGLTEYAVVLMVIVAVVIGVLASFVAKINAYLSAIKFT